MSAIYYAQHLISIYTRSCRSGPGKYITLVLITVDTRLHEPRLG